MTYFQKMIAAALFFLVCCDGRDTDVAEIRIKRRMIMHQFAKNDRIASHIMENGRTLNYPNLASRLAETQKLVLWRQKYANKQTIQTLLNYADSTLDIYMNLPFKDDQVVNSIKIYRKRMVESQDSLNMLNLCWYTSFAERIILDQHWWTTTSTANGITSIFPTSINDSIFTPGDTALVLVSTFGVPNNWNMRFDNVRCTNQRTGAVISANIKNLDDFFLVRYLPNEKGKYLIRGHITLCNGSYSTRLSIANEFDVI
jgi:hypothetical protein